MSSCKLYEECQNIMIENLICLKLNIPIIWVISMRILGRFLAENTSFWKSNTICGKFRVYMLAIYDTKIITIQSPFIFCSSRIFLVLIRLFPLFLTLKSEILIGIRFSGKYNWRLIKENSDTMLVLKKTYMDVIWLNASVLRSIKLWLVSSNSVCWSLSLDIKNLYSGDIAVSEKTVNKLMKTSSDSNTAIWNAYPDSKVDLWDQNLVNGEYVIAFELNPGLGQSLQNLLPQVCKKLNVSDYMVNLAWALRYDYNS